MLIPGPCVGFTDLRWGLNPTAFSSTDIFFLPKTLHYLKRLDVKVQNNNQYWNWFISSKLEPRDFIFGQPIFRENTELWKTLLFKPGLHIMSWIKQRPISFIWLLRACLLYLVYANSKCSKDEHFIYDTFLFVVTVLSPRVTSCNVWKCPNRNVRG